MTKTPTGIGVDASGGPVFDPSENVKALNEASHKRQDDLREMFTLYVQSELKRVEEVANLKAEQVKEIQEIHQAHDYALHRAKAGRLDALRQNDREDVKVLAAQTAAKADALQSQVSTTAATLQNQVSTTNEAATKNFMADQAEQNKRLSAIERQQAEGMGKATVESPMMAELVAETKALRASMSINSGEKSGKLSQREMIAWIIGLLAIVFSVYTNLRRG